MARPVAAFAPAVGLRAERHLDKYIRTDVCNGHGQNTNTNRVDAFDPAALRLAVDFAGADHVLAASDYPHQIGSIAKMKSSLAALRVRQRRRPVRATR